MYEWTQLIEQAIERCRKLETQVRKERKVWETLQKRLTDAEQRPFALLYLIEQLRNLQSPNVQELSELEKALKDKANEQINHYRDLLAQALEDDGCTVEGHFPEYYVNKIIKVQIDERRYQAKIDTSFHKETVKDDISVVTVAEAVRKEIKRLFGRPFDAKEFLQTLWRAYLLALSSENKPNQVGKNVRILSVHKFVVMLKQKDAAFTDLTGKKFTPYLPDEFAVDIGKLLAEGVTQTSQGYHLHLTTIRNPREALVIVNWATGVKQNCGLLSFQKSDKGGTI